jgi:hypothetical protein
LVRFLVPALLTLAVLVSLVLAASSDLVGPN